MTRDDIIRMAREASVYSGANEMVFAASLERFAALVAAAEREPLTDEKINALELPPSGTATIRDMVRIIERAHGIGGEE